MSSHLELEENVTKVNAIARGPLFLGAAFLVAVTASADEMRTVAVDGKSIEQAESSSDAS